MLFMDTDSIRIFVLDNRKELRGEPTVTPDFGESLCQVGQACICEK